MKSIGNTINYPIIIEDDTVDRIAKKQKREQDLKNWNWDDVIVIDDDKVVDEDVAQNVVVKEATKAIAQNVAHEEDPCNFADIFGHIALATASLGVAANNMPGGRTTHSRFKIPLNLNNNSMCNIKKQSEIDALLKSSKIIIWDEASMAKRQAIEAVDRTMRDIVEVGLPFGGKIMVLGGDLRQVLPVIKHGTRAQIVDSSLRMSPLWSLIKKMCLTINMRVLTDPWFSKFLLRVGDGDEESIGGNFIRIPNDMTITYNKKDEFKNALIDAIFPSMENKLLFFEIYNF